MGRSVLLVGVLRVVFVLAEEERERYCAWVHRETVYGNYGS